MASKLIAIIAGVGPGTGAAIARKFALAYPVVLMARKPDNYDSLVKEINNKGGKAIGISTNVADASSVKSAMGKIEKEFGSGVGCAAAIFNASSGFVRKPFLEMSETDFTTGYEVSGKGAFLFSQATLPLLLRSLDQSPQHPPTLIFTGATASLKGGPQLSSFASGKFALRALSQSLAREFMPKGVHVSHAIIDGVIDIPRTKEWMKDAGPDAKIAPEGIAESYWGLHVQPRSAWTVEIDVRPWVERW